MSDPVDDAVPTHMQRIGMAAPMQGGTRGIDKS